MGNNDHVLFRGDSFILLGACYEMSSEEAFWLFQERDPSTKVDLQTIYRIYSLSCKQKHP